MKDRTLQKRIGRYYQMKLIPLSYIMFARYSHNEYLRTEVSGIEPLAAQQSGDLLLSDEKQEASSDQEIIKNR